MTGVRRSVERSENAHGSVHLGLLTARHIAESHPPSVSSFLPASAFTRPRAKRLLCYVQPDVILDSGVQQVDSRASARLSERVRDREIDRKREWITRLLISVRTTTVSLTQPGL